jgi:DNA helicase II / ATP-dependent DNA helicase PcrA
MNLIAIEQLLGSLNEEQKKAVAIGPGRAAIVGNPGAGKTRCMIARLVRLAREGYDLRWCLVTTFTRAAAAEINSRLEALGITVGRVGTMHSLCAEINSLELIDLTAGLTLDESGFKTTMLLKRVLSSEKYRNAGSYNLDEINRLFSIAKTSGPCPVFGNPFGLQVEASKHLKKICEENEDLTGLPARFLVDAFCDYEKMRAANNLYDYDDMQSWAWQYLLTAPDAKLTEWINKHSLVMIDEAQDMDPMQFDVAYLLSGLCSQLVPGRGVHGHGNLCIYGDFSQSIYGFRGASPDMFVDFATDPGTGSYPLPVNYRSNKDICALASSLVREKPWHLAGDIQPGPDAEQLMPPLSHGAPIRFQEFLNSNYEAQWVVAEAMRMREELGSWRSMAVLSRLSMFLNLVELECIRNNIPYEKRASGDFVGGRDIAAIVGYLRVAGGWDPTGKWERAIINTPFRYIGKDALYKADTAKKPGESYIDTLLDVAKLSVRQRESLRDLRQLLVVLRKRIEKGAKPQELLKSVLKWTGFMESLRQESGTTGIDSTKMAVVANIEWLSGLYDSTQEFLAYMDQLGEGLKLGRKRLKTEDSSQDALVLSTIHSFKGQEASVVFLCDLVQGRHPWDRAHSMDEELRLAYVAVSRAKLALTITFSRSEDGIKSSILRKLLSQATILTTQLNRLEIPSHLERVQKEPPF